VAVSSAVKKGIWVGTAPIQEREVVAGAEAEVIELASNVMKKVTKRGIVQTLTQEGVEVEEAVEEEEGEVGKMHLYSSYVLVLYCRSSICHILNFPKILFLKECFYYSYFEVNLKDR